MPALRSWFHGAVITALAAALCFGAVPARAETTIPVTTIADTVNADAYCSLREAIQAANTDAAVGACPAGTGFDTISFNIAGGGAWTIVLGSTLVITAPVSVDGRTQPGYTNAPLIELRGDFDGIISIQPTAGYSIIKGLRFTNEYAGTSVLVDDLDIYAEGVTVTSSYFNTEGTSIYGTKARGIEIHSSSNSIGGPSAGERNLFAGAAGIAIAAGSYNTIENNYFGVQASDGSTVLTGPYGTQPAIKLSPYAGASTHNTIRGNVITNFDVGIELDYPTNTNTIAGNHIGVGANGTTAVSNGEGIALYGSSSNTIGGLATADRNVISGNSGEAQVYLQSSAGQSPDSNVIIGNYFGTDATGSLRVDPAGTGIQLVDGSGNIIGANAAGAGNLISGFVTGIAATAGADSNYIIGNRIGTDASGTAALPNHTGIRFYGTSGFVGDSLTPGNNLISGNLVGISLGESSGTTIYGNRIGVNADGTGAIPNSTGISLDNAAATIAGNWIANQDPNDGIYLEGTSSIGVGSSYNCFSRNARDGVLNLSSTGAADFTNNWWGSYTGPHHPTSNPAGTGDTISDNVNYVPYLTHPPAACHHDSIGITGDGWYFLRLTNNAGPADLMFPFGWAGPAQLTGDWDGDGKSTIGIDDGGWFFLRNTNSAGNADTIFQYGWAGATPLTGDWDGDGRDTIGIYSNGWFFLRNSNSPGPADVVFSFGWPGVTPLVGDWDGNGTDTIGIHTAGTFYLRNSNSAGPADLTFAFGWPGPAPVVGDWDGDGDTTVGIYSAGTFFLRNTNAPGSADLIFSYGWTGAKPVSGDWLPPL